MKLIYHYYLPDTGETKIVLADRYGQYVGTSKAHPDDLETASEFAGARLAERRAWIKALKSDIRRFKTKRKALLSFAEDLYNLYPVPDDISKCLNIHLNKYDADIQEAETAIQTLQDMEKRDIKMRDEILQRAKKNK